MVSQPDETASLGSNSPSDSNYPLPLDPVVFPPANYPLPLPDSDEELEDVGETLVLVAQEEVLPGGFLWESDGEEGERDEGLGGRRSSARLIEIESRVGSMVSERGDGGGGLMRRGSSSAHRVQKEEEGCVGREEEKVGGSRQGKLVEDGEEEEEEGWW